MAVKPGWTGRVYEDFTVGDIYEHPLGRTLLDADNTWFTLLTQNTNPIHFDEAWSAQTEFKKPLINSCLTLSLVTGQSVTDLSQNVMANLGWDEIKLPHPVFGARGSGFDNRAPESSTEHRELSRFRSSSAAWVRRRGRCPSPARSKRSACPNGGRSTRQSRPS